MNTLFKSGIVSIIISLLIGGVASTLIGGGAIRTEVEKYEPLLILSGLGIWIFGACGLVLWLKYFEHSRSYLTPSYFWLYCCCIFFSGYWAHRKFNEK
jgi:hypothetical protein